MQDDDESRLFAYAGETRVPSAHTAHLYLLMGEGWSTRRSAPERKLRGHVALAKRLPDFALGDVFRCPVDLEDDGSVARLHAQHAKWVDAVPRVIRQAWREQSRRDMLTESPRGGLEVEDAVQTLRQAYFALPEEQRTARLRAWSKEIKRA